MSLAYEVESLDALPEAVRGFYVPSDDGRYVIALDGAPGLTSALKKERAAHKALQNELRPLGETAEQRAERIASISTASATIEQIRTLAAQEKATMAAELESMRAHEHSTIASMVLAAALAEAKVTDNTADLIAQRLMPRIKIVSENGKRLVTIMQADGVSPMLNKDGAPAGFADLTSEAMQTWPDCFQGTGAGGGGTSTKQKASTSKTITRSEFDRMSPQVRADRMRNGYTIVD